MTESEESFVGRIMRRSSEEKRRKCQEYMTIYGVPYDEVIRMKTDGVLIRGSKMIFPLTIPFTGSIRWGYNFVKTSIGYEPLSPSDEDYNSRSRSSRFGSAVGRGINDFGRALLGRETLGVGNALYDSRSTWRRMNSYIGRKGNSAYQKIGFFTRNQAGPWIKDKYRTMKSHVNSAVGGIARGGLRGISSCYEYVLCPVGSWVRGKFSRAHQTENHRESPTQIDYFSLEEWENVKDVLNMVRGEDGVFRYEAEDIDYSDDPITID